MEGGPFIFLHGLGSLEDKRSAFAHNPNFCFLNIIFGASALTSLSTLWAFG